MRCFVALALVALTACGSTDPKVLPVTITSISPTSGPQAGGTTVTITGANLPPTSSITSVSFGTVPAASFNVESGTSATVVTPAHSAGTVSVTVKLTSGDSATLANAFTFIAAPSITAISPNSGPITGGTSVTVTGSGFQSGATLTIGGSLATGLTITPTQITATTPSGSAGVKTVVVKNPDGQEGVATDAFTYNGPPVVTSISPNSGPTVGGTAVTVVGSGFQAGATLSIGGTLATGLTVTATQITATSPAGSAGVKSIVVKNPDGQEGLAADAFTYVAVTPPTVSSLTRDVGSTNGGAVLRVNGANFVSGAVVAFGSVNATTTFISPTVLQATVPAQAAGTVAVTVSQSGVTSSTSANFEYLPAPTTTFASSDFENDALGPFGSEIYGAGETVTVSTDRAFSGTRAVKATAPIAGHQAEINYTLTDNRMLVEPNGVYIRFYIYVPDATVNSAQGGQIKLQLVRSNNVPPAWLMVGVGSQFSGVHSRALVTMIDNATVHIPGQFWSNFDFGDTTGWVEVQYWYTRKNGTGRARVWYNGKLASDVTDNRLGGDLPATTQRVRLGIVYQQDMVGASVVYLDKVAIANGFIDP